MRFNLIPIAWLPSVLGQAITPSGPIVNSASYTAPPTAKYNYVDALHKSFLFYWAQRSGIQPYDRLAWRTSSCQDCKGDYGEDLSGGWYEAANTMKWGGPYGFTVMQLAWNVIEFGDAMKAVGEYEEAVAWVKHGAEYLLNVYTTSGGEERLVGVYGVSAAVVNGKTEDIDFGYFGPPEEYTQWAPFNYGRKAFYCIGSASVNKGCTEIAADYAAALAAAAVALRPVDAAFADRCLAMAKTIYNFGIKYEKSYQDPIFSDIGWVNYREWYPSTGYKDELALASTWLYLATRDQTYFTQSQSYTAQTDITEYSWADNGIAAAILLYRETKDPTLRARIDEYFKNLLPGGSIPRTPRGLVYLYKWGSLRYAANAAFLALTHAKTIGAGDASGADRLKTFAVQQINYILGDCGRSWVGGFGVDSPKLPYHKGSYNSFIDYPMRGQDNGATGTDFLYSRTPNRFILYGALVGGPNQDDSYVDNREDYVFTEVTQDYNAAFSGCLAGLVEHYGPGNFGRASDCGLDLGWNHPGALAGGRSKPLYASGDCYHTCDACSLSPQVPQQPKQPNQGGTIVSQFNPDSPFALSDDLNPTPTNGVSSPLTENVKSGGMGKLLAYNFIGVLGLTIGMMMWFAM